MRVRLLREKTRRAESKLGSTSGVKKTIGYLFFLEGKKLLASLCGRVTSFLRQGDFGLSCEAMSIGKTK